MRDRMRGSGGIALAALGALAIACGGCRSQGAERQRLALELADALRQEALKLSDEEPRERLVKGLQSLRDLWVERVELKPLESSEAGPALPAPPGGTGPVPAWAAMFAPKSLEVGYFTRTRDFDGMPGDDGIEVRVQPMDQFGDPTKAVGSYRVEVFMYQYKSDNKRGQRLGHWFVSVLDAESNRTYYDPIDRSYVFPLLWDQPLPRGLTVIVQVTYYPPTGFDEKLIAQRVIRIGEE